MTEQFKKFDPEHYMNYPAPLNTTQREVQMIYDALSAVAPSGGGSAPFTLARKVLEMTPYGIEQELHETRLRQFTETVLQEAEDAGAIIRVVPGALKPSKLVIRKHPDPEKANSSHPLEFVVEFEGRKPNQGARTECRDVRQCMCMANAFNMARGWSYGGRDLPVEWQDGLTLEP